MSMSTPMAMPPAKRQRVDTGGGDAPPVQPQPQPHPGYQYPYPYPYPHMQIQMQMPPMQAVPGMPPNGLPPINFPPMDSRLQSIISALAQPMIQSQVEKIPFETLQKIVVETAAADPNGILARAIKQTHAEIIERERTRVLNFDGYSKEAWYQLNQKYDHLSCSKQYDASSSVESTIGEMLDSILDRTDENSSYGTKKSAIETMRKILKSFVEVIEAFDSNELERLVTEDDGQWLEKVRELVKLANDYCILGKLKDGLAMLEGEYEEDEDEDESEDDEHADEGEGDERPGDGHAEHGEKGL